MKGRTLADNDRPSDCTTLYAERLRLLTYLLYWLVSPYPAWARVVSSLPPNRILNPTRPRLFLVHPKQSTASEPPTPLTDNPWPQSLTPGHPTPVSVVEIGRSLSFIHPRICSGGNRLMSTGHSHSTVCNSVEWSFLLLTPPCAVMRPSTLYFGGGRRVGRSCTRYWDWGQRVEEPREF